MVTDCRERVSRRWPAGRCLSTSTPTAWSMPASRPGSPMPPAAIRSLASTPAATRSAKSCRPDGPMPPTAPPRVGSMWPSEVPTPSTSSIWCLRRDRSAASCSTTSTATAAKPPVNRASPDGRCSSTPTATGSPVPPSRPRSPIPRALTPSPASPTARSPSARSLQLTGWRPIRSHRHDRFSSSAVPPRPG